MLLTQINLVLMKGFFFHKLLLIKAKMYRTNSLMKYHSLLKMKKKYNELNTDIKKIE